MGIIYFASCGLSNDTIKIGYSDDPERRIKRFGLPDVELVAMLPGSMDQETELHERFKHLRLGNSEWFRLDHELRTLVANLRKQYQIVQIDDEIKEASNLLISPSELVRLDVKDITKKLQESSILLIALKKRGPKRRDGVKEYNKPFAILVQWPLTSASLKALVGVSEVNIDISSSKRP